MGGSRFFDQGGASLFFSRGAVVFFSRGAAFFLVGGNLFFLLAPGDGDGGSDRHQLTQGLVTRGGWTGQRAGRGVETLTRLHNEALISAQVV